MLNKKVLEFYKKIANDKSFSNNLLKIKNESKNISDPQKRLHKIINDLIIPTAKNEGYDFTEKELLEYESQIEPTELSKLKEDEISSVSGGANKLMVFGLTALIGASFATVSTSVVSAMGNGIDPTPQATSVTSSPRPSVAASPSLIWSNFKESDTSFAKNLTGVRYKPIGGGSNTGRLELTFDPNFTEDVVITTDDIANLLLDNDIDIELSNSVDIETLSNTNITLGENLKNTVVNMEIDRTIKSVSVRSLNDPSVIFTLSKNGDTWLLTLSKPGTATISSEDLANLGRGWDTDINAINTIEVANKGKLTFTPEFEKAGWKATNASSWFGNWKYSKTTKASQGTATTVSPTAKSDPVKPQTVPPRTKSDSPKVAYVKSQTVSPTAKSDLPKIAPVKSQSVENMVGLVNLGNSCFLNSEFQQLYNISRFKQAILSLQNIDPQTQPTAFGLQMLFNGMQDAANGDQGAIKKLAELPKLAIEIMNKSPKGAIYEEATEDSHEALIKILDRCSEESATLKPIIAAEFNIQGNSLISVDGIDISSTPVISEGLELPIDKAAKNQSLENALSEYFKTEDVDKYRVEPDKLVTAQKTFRATHLPHTLPLQLKRFSFDVSPSGEFRSVKLNNRVEFPETLNLDAEHWGEDCQYKLTGVVIHSGTAGGGHYYSYVKNPDSGDWYKLNDSQVTRIGSFENIREECFGGPQTTKVDGATYTFENETNAYMLFYSRA